ncbi:hypothetical protein [Nonomuraea phyllanthi]|nr:hypothetical protein [Nonomuraea phyllanthi]
MAACSPAIASISSVRNWRIVTELRLNPALATMLLRALLVLTTIETTR